MIIIIITLTVVSTASCQSSYFCWQSWRLRLLHNNSWHRGHLLLWGDVGGLLAWGGGGRRRRRRLVWWGDRRRQLMGSSKPGGWWRRLALRLGDR
jgi:hypothetical protein